MNSLCNNNKKLPIRFSVYSFRNFGQHKCYGSVITSLREIEMGRKKLELKNKRGKTAGFVEVSQILMDLRPSMLSYLSSGWRISCGVAIDFTLSNRPYDDPRSLHSQDMRRVQNMNQYEKALFEVGTVLEPYSLDNKFYMLGFGGAPSYMQDPKENGITS